MRNRRWFALAAFIAALVVPGIALGAAISVGSYVLGEGQVQAEDAYVVAETATVDGVIEGDLVVATSRLTIRGTVTGDVLVLTQGSVVIPGVVEGSLRGVARSVHVSGEVRDDIAVVAVDTILEGNAGRDLLTWSWGLDINGRVGRDVLGRAGNVTVDGFVGGSVDMVVRSMDLTAGAEVGGNVTHRTGGITVDEEAVVGGQINAMPGRAGFFVQFVLALVRLLGMVATVAGGIVLLWLAPRTTSGALDGITANPWRTLGIGVAATVGGALLFVVLVTTLVGIPLAVMLLLVALLAWFFGALPAATAAGRWALRGRGGAYAGYVAGILALYGVLVFVPAVGLPIFLIATAWGIGAWFTGAWRSRGSAVPPVDAELSPSA